MDPAQTTLSEQIIGLKQRIDSMQKLLDASSTIATLDPLQATDNIVAETCGSTSRLVILVPMFLTRRQDTQL